MENIRTRVTTFVTNQEHNANVENQEFYDYLNSVLSSGAVNGFPDPDSEEYAIFMIAHNRDDYNHPQTNQNNSRRQPVMITHIKNMIHLSIESGVYNSLEDLSNFVLFQIYHDNHVAEQNTSGYFKQFVINELTTRLEREYQHQQPLQQVQPYVPLNNSQCGNATDPVFYNRIPEGNAFKLDNEDRCYNINTIKGCIAVGNSFSPFTRIAFSQNDLNRISAHNAYLAHRGMFTRSMARGGYKNKRYITHKKQTYKRHKKQTYKRQTYKRHKNKTYKKQTYKRHKNKTYKRHN